MAQVRMKKLILASSNDERERILEILQSQGSVQLIDLKDMPQGIEGVDCFKDLSSVAEAEADYNSIRFTYEFLKQYKVQKESLVKKKPIISKKEFDQIGRNGNWHKLYERCKHIDECMSANKNKKSKLLSSIESYNDWSELDICEDDIKTLKKVAYFMGSLAQKFEPDVFKELKDAYDDIYIEKISAKKQDVNLFILCHVDDALGVYDILKKYGFVKAAIDLKVRPAERIKELYDEISRLDSEYKSLLKEASDLVKSLDEVKMLFDYMACRLEKEKSVSNLIKTNKAFVLEGWVPEEDGLKLKKALEEEIQDIYFGLEDPEEGEYPPVALKNNAFAEPFEMITSMYGLPKPSEVDPTPILAPFYVVFFGMMAADVGYGLIMLIASLIAIRFFDLEGDSEKLMKVIFYCSIPTIFFGFLFGGFFGNAIPLKPLWLNPVDNPMDVLYVSLALGVVHLFTGLGVKAYSLIKDGKVWDAVFDVFFWYALLTGLIWLLLSNMVSLPGVTIAKYMSITGAIGLVLTQGRSNATILGKLFGGIYGLYGVTSYIGDVLSYSRLLALGLATRVIGSSFNLLIGLMGKGFFAVVFGALIFVFGHTFNFLIGMLGTFVHTCRLEYLEFFGKFYEGGGEPFKPLRLKTKFIKVNMEK